MIQDAMLGLGVIIVLGIISQWLGWRLKVPAIIFLLAAGLFAGPVIGLIDPDMLLGEALYPFVSISVAFILFEGALALNLDDLRESRQVVRGLLTTGVLVTWVASAAAAYFIFGLDPQIAILLGAVLVVSGPTVVIPLLNFIKPTPRIKQILQWEGMMVDPIGATLAVLVVEVIAAGNAGVMTVPELAGSFIVTLGVGTLAGLAGAGLTYLTFRDGWIPHHLWTAITLIVAMGSFFLSNAIRDEAGLMAVTVMGVVLANQKAVKIEHIISFQEEIGQFLLSVLFVMLAARVNLSDMLNVGLQGGLFVLILVLLIRPLAVWFSSNKSDLSWQEKTFIAALAPRGIVAAFVSSFFALELEELGIHGAENLVAITFIVIIGTVLIYSAIASPLARKLDVLQKPLRGTIIVGAHNWARQIAHAIQKEGFEVWVVDTKKRRVRTAQEEGLTAIHGNILSEEVQSQLPMEKIVNFLSLTSNIEINALASVVYQELLGGEHVFTLNSETDGFRPTHITRITSEYLEDLSEGYKILNEHFEEGGVIQTLRVDEDLAEKGCPYIFAEGIIPLMMINEEVLGVVNPLSFPTLKPGQVIIGLNLQPAVLEI